MINTIFDFIGDDSGEWKVTSITTIKGNPITAVSHLTKASSNLVQSDEGIWTLKGIVSNLRYTEKEEKEKLVAVQEDLGRPNATLAAFIPIRKSEAWWNLAQDERRKIMENKSQHTQTGMKYLPAIARKLFHSRDIGEPFDFLTWFEYSPTDADAFEELLVALRKTEEWTYVDREIDIRLMKKSF
ncbi:chlorite dismutase family protein [Flavobacterium franklandianum]|uniref:chlorite dismutase family protein n=1 Tax=Flavobacterium franklandianum TaxID=2594430 RepID=UPI0011799B14|nr:chlorite dismutase family protein [Flavobacterium franklandianum]TRX29698.1 chlorite dismutase family protein [Flavobacterium franklandianum]